TDCEEFIRAVYTYAFENDKTDDKRWIAAYVATRLLGKALRWYSRQDKTVKQDWSALQVALLDQYPPSDDEEDVAKETKAQQLPNVPTPAAAAPPFAGLVTAVGPPKNVPTPAAAAASPNEAPIPVIKAPVFPSVKQITISSCCKARIRVEDQRGTVQGWISDDMTSTNQLTDNPREALHVKAKKVNSGPTTLLVLNVNGWSRIGIRWSELTFDSKDGD
ncbi:hypothetical protein FS837_007802, partial [Tulasnella sp. UAMH 9824]